MKKSKPDADPAAEKISSRRRIMVVDDHPITRLGLASLINAQADLMVCAEAGEPATAIGALAQARPDLVLADLRMPGRSGIEFIKDLLAIEPAIKILAITMQEESDYAERVLRSGARGFIMKNVGGETVLAAVRHVLAGNIYASPAFSARLLDNLSRPSRQKSTSPLRVLSDRELEVYQLIGEGSESAMISQQLRISRKTVDVHRATIKKKLGLASATELIRHALRWAESEGRAAAPGATRAG